MVWISSRNRPCVPSSLLSLSKGLLFCLASMLPFGGNHWSIWAARVLGNHNHEIPTGHTRTLKRLHMDTQNGAWLLLALVCVTPWMQIERVSRDLTGGCWERWRRKDGGRRKEMKERGREACVWGDGWCARLQMCRSDARLDLNDGVDG